MLLTLNDIYMSWLRASQLQRKKKNQGCNCGRECVQRKKRWKGGRRTKRDQLAPHGKSKTNLRRVKSDEF